MGKPMDQAGTTQWASPGRLIGQRKVGAIAAATGSGIARQPMLAYCGRDFARLSSGVRNA
jgi:hypothetical protein